MADQADIRRLLFFLLVTYQFPVLVVADQCPAICECSLLTTLCRRNSDGFVPDDLPVGTEVLSIQGILNDNDDSCSPITGNFTDLLSVSVRNNNLQIVCNNTLSDLTTVQKLYLNHNSISVLHKRAFAGLHRLREVYLDHNALSELPGECFSGLANLHRLSLPFNHLSVLSLSDLTSLRVLNLSSNKFNSLPSLGGIPRLEMLDLSHNDFTSISVHSLYKMKSIEVMDLSANPVSVLGPGSMDSIHVVELRLNSMPNLMLIEAGAFHNLPNLRRLQLKENEKLAFIDPDAFSGVDQLQNLDIAGSGLLAFPPGVFDVIGGIPSIDLTGNPLVCACTLQWMRRLQESVVFRNVSYWTCQEAQQTRHLSEIMTTRAASTECGPLAELLRDEDQDYIGNAALQYHCRGIGDPAPAVHWRIPNNRILNGSYSDGKFTLYPSGTLSILRPTKSDSGMYTCVAQSGSQSNASSVILNVH
ncbi:hypothetical protein CAPTEDRAFT_136803, partial [Capitella teleta]